jgi:hypothetical protein
VTGNKKNENNHVLKELSRKNERATLSLPDANGVFHGK